MTLLTTFLDFTDTGILDIFIDEAMVRMRELTLGAESPGGGSLLKGQELATTFSFLRPNDLVWNYVVANYLKGETPPPFDLLYWNSDGTNLPGPMYCWYLRNTYLENNLAKPGRLTVCGAPVDLGAIDAPAYLYASREDHIVPWKGAYQSTAVLRRRASLRARRLGTYRRRDQPAAEEEAQPLDQQDAGPAGLGRGLVRRRPGASGQLVGRLVGLAQAVRGQACRRAEVARHADPETDRAGTGPLREGKGLSLSASFN